MNGMALDALRDIIQEDVGKRGLRTDPENNLITACARDFRLACENLAGRPDAGVAVVTGFYIPHAEPPCGETDGPLGAVFMARSLAPLGIRVAILTDRFCVPSLEAGLDACGLSNAVVLCPLPPAEEWAAFLRAGWPNFLRDFPLTHLIALERAGPSHTPASVHLQPSSNAATVALFEREVSRDHFDRCHTMGGFDITVHMSPAHLLFEHVRRWVRSVDTIGIADGGNEIGMGKIPWDVIRRNIPGGALIACRVPTDYLLVCGVSNWGAYGLATGVRLLRGVPYEPELYDLERERELLRIMVERGPLVDGSTGKQTVSVDGLSFERYAEPLRKMARLWI